MLSCEIQSFGCKGEMGKRRLQTTIYFLKALFKCWGRKHRDVRKEVEIAEYEESKSREEQSKLLDSWGYDYQLITNAGDCMKCHACDFLSSSRS